MTSLALRPRKCLPDTDYRSYFIYKSLNMSFLLQGKSGTELGEAAVTWLWQSFWQTRAVKFDWTFESLSNSDRTPNGTFHVRKSSWKFANPNFWSNLELNNPAWSVLLYTHKECAFLRLRGVCFYTHTSGVCFYTHTRSVFFLRTRGVCFYTHTRGVCFYTHTWSLLYTHTRSVYRRHAYRLAHHDNFMYSIMEHRAHVSFEQRSY